MSKGTEYAGLPRAGEIFAWIEELSSYGHRKTGTPEGRKSAEFIARTMKEIGLENVRIEEVPSVCMFPQEWGLEVGGREIESYLANGTNRPAEVGIFDFNGDGAEQELVFLGDGTEEDFAEADVSGRIAVCSIRFHEANPRVWLAYNPKAELYDPDEHLDAGGRKMDIYSPGTWPWNYFRALLGGADGFVGILEDYLDDPWYYCEDYTDLGYPQGIRYMRIPGLWISRSEGRKLKEAFAENGVLRGVMQASVRYEEKMALNVSGRLRGMSEECLVIHSHHDAVFNGAVQDASGVSEMLTLAKYFAGVPSEERPKSLLFAALDTHFTGYEGHQAFIRSRQWEGVKMLLDVAIEHIGKEAVFDEAMNLIETGRPEPRMVYVTEGFGLEEIVKKAFEDNRLTGTIFFPVAVGSGSPDDEDYEFAQDEIISDAYYFNASGIPVVSMVCGEQYLFHPSDTLERIPMDQLEPVGKAFVQIVSSVMRMN
jgi:hypothetical protein